MAYLSDTQRAKVYRGETGLPNGTRFSTLEECQDFVDRVCARAYIQREFPRAAMKSIRVQHTGPSATSSWASYSGIHLSPRFGMTERTILHELAHVLVGLHVEHNWEFCAGHIKLVRNVSGKRIADRLIAGYKREGVKYRKPVKTNFTPEQRAKFSESMKAAAKVRAETKGQWRIRVRRPDGKVYFVLRDGSDAHGARHILSSYTDGDVWAYPDQARKVARKFVLEGRTVTLVDDYTDRKEEVTG